MKRLAVIFLSLAVASACTSCAFGNDNIPSFPDDDIIDTVDETAAKSDTDEVLGNYKIAMITNSDGINSQTNLTAWEGIVTYGDSTATSYKYYTAEDDTPQSGIDAVKDAVNNSAKIVVFPSEEFTEIIGEVQDEYPDVSFLLVNGIESGSENTPENLGENVHCIEFKEEQAGYLAGYFSVMEGYRSLAFIGDGDNDSNMRYTYGLVQGADSATQELRVHDVNVKYTFTDPTEDKAKSVADSLYESGVEVIFACNDTVCKGVSSSAEENDKKMISAERSHSEFGDEQLTSIVYNSNEAIELSLSSFFSNNGTWIDGAAGKTIRMGIENGCISAVTDEGSWHFENFGEAFYQKLCDKFVNNEINISSAADTKPPIATVTYNYVEY